MNSNSDLYQTPNSVGSSCIFYVMGTCNKGDECKFSHDLCIEWVRGYCPDGSNCKNSHACIPQHEICAYWAFSKCTQMQCPRLHLKICDYRCGENRAQCKRFHGVKPERTAKLKAVALKE